MKICGVAFSYGKVEQPLINGKGLICKLAFLSRLLGKLYYFYLLLLLSVSRSQTIISPVYQGVFPLVRLFNELIHSAISVKSQRSLACLDKLCSMFMEQSLPRQAKQSLDHRVRIYPYSVTRSLDLMSLFIDF